LPIRFDDFELDVDARELRNESVRVGLEPKVFDLLVYLASHPDRVLTRDDIIENVWDGRIVSDAAVSSCIKAVRAALGDDGRAQRYVKTIHGRGFRFVGEFKSVATAVEPNISLDPSLALIPLDVIGDDPTLGLLADGLVEDLLTTLSRVPSLNVASRRSCFALRDTTMSPQEIHDALKATYIVEGSIQATADGCRVRLQLVRAETGFHSWAQQFDVTPANSSGDDVLTAVLPRLETALVETMVADLTEEDGVRSINAQLIHAMGLLSLKGWNPATFAEAETVLRDLLKRDPDHAVGRAYLALILGLGARVGVFEASSDIAATTIAEAETALAQAGNESTVLGLAGCAIADVGQPERAVPILKKAIDLNPNNAQAWVAHGSALLLIGQLQEALASLERGVRISAMDAQIAVWWAFWGLATLMSGDVDHAHERALAGCRADDRNHIPRIVLWAVENARDDADAKAAALHDMLRIHPTFSEREALRLVGRKLGAVLFAEISEIRARQDRPQEISMKSTGGPQA